VEEGGGGGIATVSYELGRKVGLLEIHLDERGRWGGGEGVVGHYFITQGAYCL